MAQRAAFFICGVMTVLTGRVCSGLHRFAPTQEIAWLPFAYALLILGITAVCISFLPTAWIQGMRKTPTEHRQRNSTPFRFLLSFAALGLVLVVMFSFVPPSLARPPIPLVYSLCPACVLTVTVDPSLPTALFVLALLMRLFLARLAVSSERPLPSSANKLLKNRGITHRSAAGVLIEGPDRNS